MSYIPLATTDQRIPEEHVLEPTSTTKQSTTNASQQPMCSQSTTPSRPQNNQLINRVVFQFIYVFLGGMNEDIVDDDNNDDENDNDNEKDLLLVSKSGSSVSIFNTNNTFILTNIEQNKRRRLERRARRRQMARNVIDRAACILVITNCLIKHNICIIFNKCADNE